MRILHIIPSLGTGGAERVAVDACRALARKGATAQLLVLRAENSYSALTKDIDLVVQPASFIPRFRLRPAANTEAFARHIETWKPDVIHTHLFEADFVTRSLGYRGAAYVSHVHGPSTPMERRHLVPLSKRELTDRRERGLILKWYRKLGNHFIAVSDAMRQYLVGILPADLRDISVLPNAVDLQRFVPGRPRKAEAPYRLVTAGRLDARKNQRFLIEVLGELLHRGVDTTLHLLGDGPNRKALEAQSSETALQGRVVLHGAVEDVERHFQEADLYLHAARAEPFGLTLLEAMACGLPVVCLDGGGNRDFVKNGVNGYLLDFEDVSTFADRVQELLAHRRKRSQQAVEALAEAHRHGLDQWADQLLALYSRICGLPDAPVKGRVRPESEQ